MTRPSRRELERTIETLEGVDDANPIEAVVDLVRDSGLSFGEAWGRVYARDGVEPATLSAFYDALEAVESDRGGAGGGSR